MDGEPRQQGRLPRIAATLLNLAALAERAALRSLPVRFLVLAILWQAEAIARRFATSEMADVWQEADAIGQYVDDVDIGGQGVVSADFDVPAPRWPSLDEILPPSGFTLDANLLALRLRMLATILLTLADADRIHEDGRAGWHHGAFGGWTADEVRAAAAGAPGPAPILLLFLPLRRGQPFDTS